MKGMLALLWSFCQGGSDCGSRGFVALLPRPLQTAGSTRSCWLSAGSSLPCFDAFRSARVWCSGGSLPPGTSITTLCTYHTIPVHRTHTARSLVLPLFWCAGLCEALGRGLVFLF